MNTLSNHTDSSFGKLLYERLFKNKEGVIAFILLAVVLLLVFPLCLNTFRLNLTGKYLCYAFVAIGLVMCWGNAGILSLGQGMFFGAGGYCMAMFLKLEASDPESTAIQSTPGIPDFMDWNQVTELPWFWFPFKSFPLTIALIFILPAVLAFLLSVFYFKGRVTGVVFAILTQSMVACLWYFIVGNQGFFGGINGITDLRTLNGWDIRTESAQKTLYYVCSILLLFCILVSRYVLSTRLGRVLLAQRDKEMRVRFSGYNLTLFRIFIFCFAAVLSAIGGAMFTLQVGFMSPNLVGIQPSIDMVIFTAVGGRESLLGAVYGALAVNAAKTAFSEAYPTLWMFLYGATFIIIVLYLPKGLAGLYDDHIKKWIFKLKPKSDSGTTPPSEELEKEVPYAK
ncbi:MAG: urea ABC transporter permease subunit UrtC [Puniceicoccaceae bacterium TMED149]|jgi:urea transport system permease protein|nr:MAG: urea ABC transporter permease subunit UrtC [Puniceicoccaceae bacterium TMED149]PDH30604.1 MAG: urea ABC transporter permease subunit UrtC [Puniceicoccaceae bacterium MED-G30]RPG83753.1 MAG: urea ABC transporter permease subunit UrtC [Coraliomargarita sp. TMED73]|tara:strand:- start:4221 stop:5408 length:1188 start_codon:yes stop_codon:yes gene_type:complete